MEPNSSELRDRALAGDSGWRCLAAFFASLVPFSVPRNCLTIRSRSCAGEMVGGARANATMASRPTSRRRLAHPDVITPHPPGKARELSLDGRRGEELAVRWRRAMVN